MRAIQTLVYYIGFVSRYVRNEIKLLRFKSNLKPLRQAKFCLNGDHQNEEII